MLVVRRLYTDKVIVSSIMVIVWDKICPTAVGIGVWVGVGEESQEDCSQAHDTGCPDEMCCCRGDGSCAHFSRTFFFWLSVSVLC